MQAYDKARNNLFGYIDKQNLLEKQAGKDFASPEDLGLESRSQRGGTLLNRFASQSGDQGATILSDMTKEITKGRINPEKVSHQIKMGMEAEGATGKIGSKSILTFASDLANKIKGKAPNVDKDELANMIFERMDKPRKSVSINPNAVKVNGKFLPLLNIKPDSTKAK